MTAALSRTFAVDRPSRVPVEPRPSDRWRSQVPPNDRRPALLLALLAGSLALHAIVFATIVVGGRPSVPPAPHAIAVEIVQEAPKPPPKAPPAQTAAAKPAPAPPPPAKMEQPKPEPAKVEQIKPEPPKSEPPKLEQAKVEQAKTQSPKPQALSEKPPAADPSELAALEKELATLKAEHAALAAEPQASSGGTLPKSFQAVALPGADGDGEIVGYQEIVFSQLAKAKGLGRKQGVPGTAGVRFSIDDNGALVTADIATPSGIAALDAEALDIVHKAAPFPPPPKGAQREFYANVNFVPQATP